MLRGLESNRNYYSFFITSLSILWENKVRKKKISNCKAASQAQFSNLHKLNELVIIFWGKRT